MNSSPNNKPLTAEELSELGQLRWQCRRGLLELDVLLGNFLEANYASFSPTEKAAFVRLLQCTDQELLYWFTHQEQPPTDLMDIIERIHRLKG